MPRSKFEWVVMTMLAVYLVATLSVWVGHYLSVWLAPLALIGKQV